MGTREPVIEEIARAMGAVENCKGGDCDCDAIRRKAQGALAAITKRLVSSECGQVVYEAWDKFGDDPVMGPEEAIAILRAIADHLDGGKKP